MCTHDCVGFQMLRDSVVTIVTTSSTVSFCLCCSLLAVVVDRLPSGDVTGLRTALFALFARYALALHIRIVDPAVDEVGNETLKRLGSKCRLQPPVEDGEGQQEGQQQRRYAVLQFDSDEAAQAAAAAVQALPPDQLPEAVRSVTVNYVRDRSRRRIKTPGGGGTGTPSEGSVNLASSVRSAYTAGSPFGTPAGSPPLSSRSNYAQPQQGVSPGAAASGGLVGTVQLTSAPAGRSQASGDNEEDAARWSALRPSGGVPPLPSSSRSSGGGGIVPPIRGLNASFNSNTGRSSLSGSYGSSAGYSHSSERSGGNGAMDGGVHGGGYRGPRGGGGSSPYAVPSHQPPPLPPGPPPPSAYVAAVAAAAAASGHVGPLGLMGGGMHLLAYPSIPFPTSQPPADGGVMMMEHSDMAAAAAAAAAVVMQSHLHALDPATAAAAAAAAGCGYILVPTVGLSPSGQPIPMTVPVPIPLASPAGVSSGSNGSGFGHSTPPPMPAYSPSHQRQQQMQTMTPPPPPSSSSSQRRWMRSGGGGGGGPSPLGMRADSTGYGGHGPSIYGRAPSSYGNNIHEVSAASASSSCEGGMGSVYRRASPRQPPIVAGSGGGGGDSPYEGGGGGATDVKVARGPDSGGTSGYGRNRTSSIGGGGSGTRPDSALGASLSARSHRSLRGGGGAAGVLTSSSPPYGPAAVITGGRSGSTTTSPVLRQGSSGSAGSGGSGGGLSPRTKASPVANALTPNVGRTPPNSGASPLSMRASKGGTPTAAGGLIISPQGSHVVVTTSGASGTLLLADSPSSHNGRPVSLDSPYRHDVSGAVDGGAAADVSESVIPTTTTNMTMSPRKAAAIVRSSLALLSSTSMDSDRGFVLLPARDARTPTTLLSSSAMSPSDKVAVRLSRGSGGGSGRGGSATGRRGGRSPTPSSASTSDMDPEDMAVLRTALLQAISSTPSPLADGAAAATPVVERNASK